MPQSWCNPCKAEYGRERRAGKVEVLLTPEEWALIKAMRADPQTFLAIVGPA